MFILIYTSFSKKNNSIIYNTFNINVYVINTKLNLDLLGFKLKNKKLKLKPIISA